MFVHKIIPAVVTVSKWIRQVYSKKIRGGSQVMIGKVLIHVKSNNLCSTCRQKVFLCVYDSVYLFHFIFQKLQTRKPVHPSLKATQTSLLKKQQKLHATVVKNLTGCKLLSKHVIKGRNDL